MKADNDNEPNLTFLSLMKYPNTVGWLGSFSQTSFCCLISSSISFLHYLISILRSGMLE